MTASRHQLRHGYSLLNLTKAFPDIAFIHWIKSLGDHNRFQPTISINHTDLLHVLNPIASSISVNKTKLK